LNLPLVKTSMAGRRNGLSKGMARTGMFLPVAAMALALASGCKQKSQPAPDVWAVVNGQEIKLVKVKGEFPWHRHQQEDEFFLVWKGRFRVEFRDHIVEMSPGECVVVPRGVEHRPRSLTPEPVVLMFEPSTTLNTGDAASALTVRELERL